MQSVALGKFAVEGGGSVDPSRYPDEEFDLYSIPAYDHQKPVVLKGSEIGSSKKSVEPGDVLLSRIVPHIRRAWIVGPSNGRRQIASSEWIVFRGKEFDAGYLRHWLLANPFHHQFMMTVSGVGGSLLRARPTEVAKIRLPFPLLAEQKRIAAILDKADTIRRKRQQAIKLVDEFLQSVFLDMFGDPVTNPKVWPERPIGEICRIIRGSSPRPKGDPRYYGGPIPRLMVEDLTRDGWFVTPRVDSLTEEGARLSRPVPKGTLVMVVSGNVGVMARLSVDACIHDGFAGLMDIDADVALPDYLMCVLTYLKETHSKREAGAIFKNLTTDQIREMTIPLPPITEQKKFKNIFSRQRALRAQFAEIYQRDDLFASISQSAFRGEL